MKRRALVTGANRGIGLAIAKGLSELGHEVLMAGRDPGHIEQAAKDVGAQAIVLDVANPDSIGSALAQIGSVDILVNNAGVLGSGGVLDDPQDWADSMAVMVDGPYQLMRALVPDMVKNNYGRVVNVSSGWGSFSEGLQGPGAYGVAKAALNALSKSAAGSLPANVKVNAMCPGWVRTRMGGMGATRSPEQGAETAIWLATLDDNGPSGKFFRDKLEIDW